MKRRGALLGETSDITGDRSKFSKRTSDAARKKSTLRDGECFPSKLLHEEGAVNARKDIMRFCITGIRSCFCVADLSGEEAVCVRES